MNDEPHHHHHTVPTSGRNRGAARVGALIALAAMGGLLTQLAGAQTRESGPWWPNEEWGPDDQAGASNRITDAKVMEALQLATTGRIYELGQVYEQGMPLFGSRSYSIVLPARDPAAGDNRIVANEEFVSTQIGQVGTQFDGLGHIGQEVLMEDGSVEHVFYNGYTASEMDTPSGLQRLGIEHVRPIVTRGVLIDIAGYQGVERLPNGYEVTVEDLLGALAAQGMSAADVTPGDAVLLRYGWSSLWNQPEAYNPNPPGIGLAAAEWIIERQVTMIGADSWGSEVFPNPDEALVFPVHQELLMKNGIFNLENMQFDELVADVVYEFAFIVTPIPVQGGDGLAGAPHRHTLTCGRHAPVTGCGQLPRDILTSRFCRATVYWPQRATAWACSDSGGSSSNSIRMPSGSKMFDRIALVLLDRASCTSAPRPRHMPIAASMSSTTTPKWLSPGPRFSLAGCNSTNVFWLT